MKLYELFTEEEAEFKRISAEDALIGLQFDSRKIGDGEVFFALNGSGVDGNQFAADALLQGAMAIVTDEPNLYCKDSITPLIIVEDARRALSLAAERFYSDAHKKVTLIGVVGTNGKTSVTYIVKAILKAFGKKVLVVGTLGITMDGKSSAADMTTPDPIELNKAIFNAWQAGAEYVVMEVSAHAIYWQKTFGMYFETLVFTNFTEDHLDFFKTMENYKAVKKSIFKSEYAHFAVVNADDPLGREILEGNEIPVVTYGIETPSDAFPVGITLTNGVRFIGNLFDELVEIHSSLNGYFNIYNLLAGLTLSRMFKIPAEIAANAVNALQPIPGRFNLIRGKKTAVIDYAHTPDGLKNVLSAARNLCKGKIICIFGCGGNRDRLKRPQMGEIAGRLADFTIITTDNSRYEEPEAIMDEIESGFAAVSDNYVRIRDRKHAVLYGLNLADVDDIVVIAGKGEENYIEEKGKKIFYMDKLVVEEAFRR